MNEREWMRDYRLESYFRRKGVEYDFVLVPLKDINWEASRNNHGRIGVSVMEDVRDDFAEAMKRLDIFPAGVMTLLPDTTPPGFIIDGMQRASAAEKIGLVHMGFYVLNNTGNFITQSLPRTLNCFNGYAPARQDKVTQGLELIDKFGLTGTEAAAEMKMPSNAFNEMVRQRKVETFLNSRNVPTVGLGKTHYKRLATIHNDTVLIAAAKVMARNLSTGATDELIAAIKAVKTEADQLEAIADIAAKLDITARSARATGGGRRRKVSETFLVHLRAVCAAVEGKTTLDQLQIVDREDQETVYNEYLVPLSRWIRAVGKSREGK